MNSIEINNDLLKSISFFGVKKNLEFGERFFDFDKRRVIFGYSAVEYLGKECQRLGLKKILLVAIVRCKLSNLWFLRRKITQQSCTISFFLPAITKTIIDTDCKLINLPWGMRQMPSCQQRHA